MWFLAQNAPGKPFESQLELYFGVLAIVALVMTWTWLWLKIRARSKQLRETRAAAAKENA